MSACSLRESASSLPARSASPGGLAEDDPGLRFRKELLGQPAAQNPPGQLLSGPRASARPQRWLRRRNGKATTTKRTTSRRRSWTSALRHEPLGSPVDVKRRFAPRPTMFWGLNTAALSEMRCRERTRSIRLTRRYMPPIQSSCAVRDKNSRLFRSKPRLAKKLRKSSLHNNHYRMDRSALLRRRPNGLFVPCLRVSCRPGTRRFRWAVTVRSRGNLGCSGPQLRLGCCGLTSAIRTWRARLWCTRQAR